MVKEAAATIPEYLATYIVEQDPSLYTPIDHASWRFIMKISGVFFARHAHEKYTTGLAATGISTERIPLISEMDACLSKLGWRAVSVSGFIPPAAFMEFLSRGILPIACDMRSLEHLAYTPAPDIVHEAAGHAPIIADAEYERYLRSYGKCAEKAIYSRQDLDVYEAIRNLSEVKENPKSNAAEIAASQKQIDEANSAVNHISEATMLSRMGWWTTEYGLIGDPSDPKIYGAGLLSSVGESYHCLSPNVPKIPFSTRCIDVTYDITKPQPQLFLAPSFSALTLALEEFSATLAFRRGGKEGLEKALKAATTTTTVLETGIQISGKLTSFLQDVRGKPCFLKFEGPTQLSYRDQELEGQGPKYHAQGFSTSIGQLRGGREISHLTFQNGSNLTLEYESGITLSGRYQSKIERDGKILSLRFTDCTIRKDTDILYQPDWGPFDLACGSRVVSVFGGAADRKRYLEATGGFGQKPRKMKTNLTSANRDLNELYAGVRKIRESKEISLDALSKIHSSLEKFPTDWLLRYELLELLKLFKASAPWQTALENKLSEISKTSSDKAEMIRRGLEIL